MQDSDKYINIRIYREPHTCDMIEYWYIHTDDNVADTTEVDIMAILRIERKHPAPKDK